MKLAILPELQQENNRKINRGLYVINVLLVLLVASTVMIGLTTYRNVHHAQNASLTGADGSVIGYATLMVPNWVIVPAKVGQDAKLVVNGRTELPASVVRTSPVNGIDFTLLRADGIPPELLLNGARMAEDETIFIADNVVEWTGRLKKADSDPFYTLRGDQQLSAGLPVTLASDHTALVGVTAAGATGPVVVTIEQLQQAFAELQ